MTYTYAILPVSRSTYDEIRSKLSEAGYQHAFHQDEGSEVIDMHGIALKVERATDLVRCTCGHTELDHRHRSSSRARICLIPECSCRKFVEKDPL